MGGPAKGIVVREIDALGGEMAKVVDKTYIQMRMLNTGKGQLFVRYVHKRIKFLYSVMK